MMATGPLSAAARAEIATLLEIDSDPAEIARCYRVHYTTVARYRTNLQYFGQPLPPQVAQGRPRKITMDAEEGLIDWLWENSDDHKTAYFDEMVHFLEEKFDIYVSKSTVSRLLKKKRFSNKNVGFKP